MLEKVISALQWPVIPDAQKTVSVTGWRFLGMVRMRDAV